MERRHRSTILAASVAVVLAATLVIAVPSWRGAVVGQRSDRPSGIVSIPESESLFLPGYEETATEFTLSDPSKATGEPITVSFALPGDAVRTGGVVGLSFDARELASPLWDSPESNLTLMLSELERPALRFGGNGVDRQMWWTSSDEPPPEWAEATVTPDDLARVAAVAEETDATVTLDLDLGHDDPERAADMAAHAQEAFGERLLAVAIGNEPNGFFHENQPQLAVRDSDWDVAAYQNSLQEYSAALGTATPGIPVSGPGAYDAKWWRGFAESGIPDQRALSLHWYPLWDCDGPASSIANPTVEDLASPALRDRARKIVDMASDVAAEHDLPLWMEETGPTSCPGTNDTSRTHAQALWTADYVMTLAENGVERVAFHSTLHACRGGAPMSPICARGEQDDPGPIVEGRSSFLALMMLSQLPDGQVLTPAVSGAGDVMVHGVIGDDGTLAVVLSDLRDPATVTDAAPVQISVPSGLAEDAPTSWTLGEGTRLSSTALDAQESDYPVPAPVTGAMEGSRLARAAPLTVTSEPGTTTVLTLPPGDGASVSTPAASDGGDGATD